MWNRKEKIIIKTEAQIKALREWWKILDKVHTELWTYVKAWISTFKLNEIAVELIEKYNCIASFKWYWGFPASICTSLNDIVVHWVPSKKDILKDWDILKIDIWVYQQKVHSDACRCYVIWENPIAQHLSETVKKAMLKWIKQARPWNRIWDIENMVQKTIERAGYCPIRDFTGHWVWENLHEAPEIMNYWKKWTWALIKEWMVLAIEPIATIWRKKNCYILEDNWSAVAKDYAIWAQWEHSVLITKDWPELLTWDFDLDLKK